MAKQQSDPDPALFTYFNEISIISQLAGNIFERSLPDGLTNSQFGVLNWFVRVDKQATPTRLATAFQVTGGAMTNTLKKLQTKGLVDIKPDANSGRQKIVTMTSKGRKLRDKAIACAPPALVEFSEKFSLSSIEKQTRELQKVRQFLDEYRYR